MDYCRLHTDILGDPKLMRAARRGAKHLGWLPWFFAFARKAEDGGRLTVGGDPAEPADFLVLIPGVTVEEVAACWEEAVAAGVMEKDPDGAYRLVNWSKRQAEQERAKTRERVRKHRGRNRGNDPSNGGGNADVTDPVTAPPTGGNGPGNVLRNAGEESRVENRDPRTVEIGNLEEVPGDCTDPGARDRQIRDRGLQLTAVIAAGGRS